eukprot:SM000072S21219  [mRNA]  locus=s72:449195:449647:+ [translate_table: standard]
MYDVTMTILHNVRLPSESSADSTDQPLCKKSSCVFILKVWLPDQPVLVSPHCRSLSTIKEKESPVCTGSEGLEASGRPKCILCFGSRLQLLIIHANLVMSARSSFCSSQVYFQWCKKLLSAAFQDCTCYYTCQGAAHSGGALSMSSQSAG